MFLEKSPEKSNSLAFYANELAYISRCLANEKCLQAFKIQQLFEQHSIIILVKDRSVKFSGVLNEKMMHCWKADTDQLEKMTVLEDVFVSFNLLGNKAKFEDLLSSDLLRRVAKATLNQPNFSSTLQSLKSLLQGDLSWLVDLSEFTAEDELNSCIWNTLANILLKGVFSKAEYFPVSDLEAYADNYQLYYVFVTDLFKQNGIPPVVRIHMKKKESLLYKSYVMHVIKKLEGSLIQLTNFISNSKNGPEIEEYCYKKSGKTLKAILQDLVLKNVSKDTMTSSLLHRVFAIGLRTIVRIKAFFEQLFDSAAETSAKLHLSRTAVDLSHTLLISLPDNIQEIGHKLNIDQKQIDSIDALFKARLKDLLYCGLAKIFDIETADTLHLEDDIAGIALKLSMQPDNIESESHILNNAKIAVEKFVNVDGLSDREKNDRLKAACQHLLVTMQNHYNKQIEDSITTMKVNDKYNHGGENKDLRLDVLIEKQKQLDVAALSNLTV